jgi:putative ABC transport system permease protein
MIRPILSALARNKTGAVLVGLQIALTLAVVANAVFIIEQRAAKIGRPPGMDTQNTIFVESYGFGPTYDQRATVRTDVETLRSLPGVVDAAYISAIPMSGGGSSSGFLATAGNKTTVPANTYAMDEHGARSLGVRLVAGRDLTEAEVQYSEKRDSDFVPSVLVSRDLAKAVFGTDEVVGKPIYDGLGQSATIVGVFENMLGAWIDWDKLTQVMFMPRIQSGQLVRYVVRVEPGRQDGLIPEIERKLNDENLSRAIISVKPHTSYTEESYRDDSRMMIFLSVIVVLMIAVTALGIVGLASFQVNTRRKQIGTRRAVGARRVDIVRYFMIENWLLTTAGALVGSMLAFAFGYWLSAKFSLPRLQPIYVVTGIGLLWILGQIAVFLPARRAAAIPPAVATRTV